MRRYWNSVVGGMVLVFLVACSPTEDFEHLSYHPVLVNQQDPTGFVKMEKPVENPQTEAGIALGRRLFYDPILSADSTISCASCHQQALAFTDGRALAVGIKGKTGQRSSMSLLNVGFRYKGLFWDGRSPNLEEQALHPIVDPVEMGSKWEDIRIKLREHPVYPDLFHAAFGIKNKSAIDSHLVAKALAQFQRSLLSHDSKYDRVLTGKAQFSPSEQRGLAIFFDADPNLPDAECGHCHLDPLFSNLAFENNGLEAVNDLADFSDLGRGKITGRKHQNGMFRVPSLRNIGKTAPYMHDGRMPSLEEVIDHYNQGGHYAENLSPNVRNLHLNDQHKADLIAFLHTLTDSTALLNPAYGPPND